MIIMKRAHRHGGCSAELRAVLFARILRPVHTLPRRSAWMNKILNRILEGMGRAKDLEMLLELEKTMGNHARHDNLRLADGTAWATRTFINKFYDEFAARCPEEPPATRVPLTIKRGTHNVATPMGFNTR